MERKGLKYEAGAEASRDLKHQRLSVLEFAREFGKSGISKNFSAVHTVEPGRRREGGRYIKFHPGTLNDEGEGGLALFSAAVEEGRGGSCYCPGILQGYGRAIKWRGERGEGHHFISRFPGDPPSVVSWEGGEKHLNIQVIL